MAVCELCGKIVDKTITIQVAGTNMQSCFACKGLGKEVDLAPQGKDAHSFYRRKKANVVMGVVENYSSVLNSALARKGLNLQQLARALNIKDSTLNKYFTGKLKPDVDTSRKLENFLEITILEEKEEVDPQDYLEESSEDSSTLSLGDLLKKQMEKENK